MPRHHPRRQRNERKRQSEPPEEFVDVDLASIAQRPEGTWLHLVEGDDVPFHRVVCNAFPVEVGLTADAVKHNVSHTECVTNQAINTIVSKWRLQGWFVHHVDGDRANNAASNMRVVDLKTALGLGESADWGLFLSKGERACVNAAKDRFVTGLVEV